ncbi:MAG: hypothetical protein ACJ74Q_10525 [Pyrinomonadaceae bacterium]
MSTHEEKPTLETPSSNDKGKGHGATSPEGDSGRADGSVLKLSKEDLVKISEDPYFQYLIGTKARSQTWAFLSIVGSVILAVLIYSGLEFKSAKDEIDKNKKDVAEQTDNIKKNNAELEKATSSAMHDLEGSRDMLTNIREDQVGSEQRANAMIAGIQAQIATSIAASRGQMDSFASAQRNFLEAQNKLLDKAVETNNEARVSAAKLNEQAMTITAQLMQQKEAAERTINSANGAVYEAKRTLADVNSKLQNVSSLEALSVELARTKALDIITLADRQQTEIWVRNVGAQGEDQSKLPRYRITFGVGDMKKSFDIEYKVESEEQIAHGVDGAWKKWHITPRHSSSSSPSLSCVPLAPATFQANLTQKYSGFFAPEFVVIKVTPRTTVDQPCKQS